MADSPFATRTRGLPAPGSSTIGAGPSQGYNSTGPYSGTGFRATQSRRGMDYSDKFRTGPANYRPGRNLPVGQILSQREGNVAARYADGTPVPRGMRINVPGWNTSGVGPGTAGYRGSYRYGGYNYGEGTSRPRDLTATDYYRNRGSSLDRFNNNAQTNRADSWSGVDGFRQYGGPVRRGGRYVV
jgi:hypothetical protein